MNTEELRSVQAPLKEHYRAAPDAALVTLHAQGRIGEGVSCKIETGKALIIAGLHPTTGGNGLSAYLPNFIEACRTALKQPDPAHAVWSIMSAIICDPAAIEAALRTEGQIDRNAAQYTFLHQSSDLTVMKVVMPGQLESPPHNHLAWVVIGMYRGARGKRLLSKERERRFRIEQARAGRA